jgi:hypothetical protein
MRAAEIALKYSLYRKRGSVARQRRCDDVAQCRSSGGTARSSSSHDLTVLELRWIEWHGNHDERWALASTGCASRRADYTAPTLAERLSAREHHSCHPRLCQSPRKGPWPTCSNHVELTLSTACASKRACPTAPRHKRAQPPASAVVSASTPKSTCSPFVRGTSAGGLVPPTRSRTRCGRPRAHVDWASGACQAAASQSWKAPDS